MPNGSITIYKLIILYTLSKVDTPLPSGIISDYITDRGYTNYYNLQNAFGELLDTELIAEDSTYRLSYYKITDAGRETLSLFGAPLSTSIRDEIDKYLSDHKYEIIDETSLVSDYHAVGDGNYLVTCIIRERNQIIMQLELSVSSEADAIKACNNWSKHSDAIFQESITRLLS